jgi:beta-lactamase regulating signal transducer with metallopeptidase domain
MPIPQITELLHIGQSYSDSLVAFSEGAATTLLTAIWQGAVVAICLAICLRLAPRTSAALRFSIWTAAFLVIAGLPFLPLLRPAQAESAGIASGAQPWLQIDIRWSLALTGLWLGASLYRAADLAIHSLRLRKLWKSAIPIDHAEMPKLSGRAAIQLCITRELDRPSVIGFLAPRILIPEWLFVRLTAAELDQIVLHETQHLRRGDDWTNLLQKLSLVLLPLNPILLWIERRLCLEREMACDEGVVRVTRAPRAYAACLAHLAERGIERRAEALSLGAWHRRPELVQRVHSLLLRRRALGPVGSGALAASVACALLFGTVELSRCPQLIAFQPVHSGRTVVAALKPLQSYQQLAVSPVTIPAKSALPRPHMIETKAIMPAEQAIAGVEGSREPVRNLLKRSHADEPTEQLSEAKIPGDSDELTSSQHWIVLTTWEQQPQFDADNMDDSASSVAYRTTVTRLIFQVVQARALSPSSVSRKPAVAPAILSDRNGWLVLQL